MNTENEKMPAPTQESIGEKKGDPSTQTNRPMTFGECLVGLTFNPSGDPKVQRAKELCAELADLLNDHTHNGQQEVTRLQSKLHDHAVGEILNAQMNVVKVLTLKY